MSKQRSEKIKVTVFISFAILMILVCAVISANIIKELKNDKAIENQVTKEYEEEISTTNPDNEVNGKKRLVSISTPTPVNPDNKNKGCEENGEFYIFNFFSKLFLAFTAGVIFSDGVYIKMGIV